MADIPVKVVITAEDKSGEGFDSARKSADGLKEAVKQAGGAAGALATGADRVSKSFQSVASSMASGVEPLRLSIEGVNLALQSTESTLQKMGGLLAGIGIAGVAAAMGGIAAASKFLSSALGEAAEETERLTRLQSVWSATNKGSREELRDLTTELKALSTSTSYAADDIMRAAGNMVAMKVITADQLIPTMRLAIDLAAFTGRSVYQSTLMLEQAALGSTFQLRRMGIVISEAAERSGDFRRIMADVAAVVSGQEAARLQTYAGAIREFGNSFRMLQESVGNILQAALLPVVQNLSTYFKNLGSDIDKAFEAGRYTPQIERLRRGFESIASGVRSMVDRMIEYFGQADIGNIIDQFFRVARVIQDLAGLAGRAFAWLLNMPDWIKTAVAAWVLYTAASKTVTVVSETVVKIIDKVASSLDKAASSALKSTTSMQALASATTQYAAAAQVANVTDAAGRGARFVGPMPQPEGPYSNIGGPRGRIEQPLRPGAMPTAVPPFTIGPVGQAITEAIGTAIGAGGGALFGKAIGDALRLEGAAATAVNVGATITGGIIANQISVALLANAPVILGALSTLLMNPVGIGVAAAVVIGTAFVGTLVSVFGKAAAERDKAFAKTENKLWKEYEGLGAPSAGEMETVKTEAIRAANQESTQVAIQAARDMAEAWAKAGKSLQEFEADYYSAVGVTVPEEAKRAYEAVKRLVDELDNLDPATRAKRRREQEIQYFKVRLEAGAAGGGGTLAEQRAKLMREIAPPEEATVFGAGLGFDKKIKLTQRQKEEQELLNIAYERAFALAQAHLKEMEKTEDSLRRQEFIIAERDKYAQMGFNIGGNERDLKNSLDKMKREISSYQKYVREQDETAYELSKANILAATQSKIFQTQMIATLDQQRTQQTVRRIDEEYNQNRKALNVERQLYEAHWAVLAAAGKEVKHEERARVLEELVKREAEIEVNRTAALQAELQKRLQAVQNYENQLASLQQEKIKVAEAARAAGSALYMAAMDEQEKLVAKTAEASAKLREAQELMPIMPERAKELAGQARQMAQGLIVDLDQFANRLRTIRDQFIGDMREIEDIGKSPIQKWQSLVEAYRQTLAQARTAEAEGKLKEAAEYYQKAYSQAKQIGTGAPEGMKGTGREMAKEALKESFAGLEGVTKKQRDEAAKSNIEQAKTIGQATDVLNTLIDKQISTVRELIDLYRNELIPALTGKIMAPPTPTAGQAGVVGTAGAPVGGGAGGPGGVLAAASKLTPEQAKAAEAAAVGGAAGMAGGGLGETIPVPESATEMDKALANFEEGLPSLASNIAKSFGSMFDKVDIAAGFGTEWDGIRKVLEGMAPMPEGTLNEGPGKRLMQEADAQKAYDERMKTLAEKWNEGVQLFVENIRKPIEVEVNLNGTGDPATVDNW